MIKVSDSLVKRKKSLELPTVFLAIFKPTPRKIEEKDR